MAILGLALTLTGQQAEAARGDRAPVARPNASRAAAPSLASRPAARPAAPRQAAARTVSSARGGHALRTAPSRSGGARVARASGRDHGALAPRGRVASRQVGRQHAVLGRATYSRGYNSAMLRGPTSRFASMSACSTVRGRRVCGGTRTVAMRWSGGLAPAAGNQSSCPDGTMATLAVGHENVVRCVPM